MSWSSQAHMYIRSCLISRSAPDTEVTKLVRTVHPKIGCLERHLNKGVRAEAVRSNEYLPVTTELECLAVVLADQVAQPRLGEADPRAQLGRVLDGPLELLWCCVYSIQYPSGWFHRFQVKECGRAWVDRASEEHETFSKDIRCEAGESEIYGNYKQEI